MKISCTPVVALITLAISTAGACAFVSPKASFHNTAQITRETAAAFARAFPPTTTVPLQHSSSTATTTRSSSSSTCLFALLNVPDGFFTVTFGVTGLMLSIMRKVHRTRMEELAWEQRLRESRERRMAADPSLIEIDLMKQEAENEWSAYGPQAMAERRNKVKVAEKETDDDQASYRRDAKMSQEEIEEFEANYGVDYDPYYDDPYDESELPDDMDFRVDKKYGDRIYEDGEVFYKDEESGMYYRQGSKPRIKSFW